MREFPDRFTGIGKFPGEYKICLCPDAHLVIHHTQKMANHITAQDQGAPGKNGSPGSNHPCRPAHRLSIINYLHTKGKHKLHLCLDPCDLNRSICHDDHKMPTVEEVAHEFANLHYFTKLDVHHGYWSIVLDEESSPLTTFNSPFGRYHFLWLPFGLVCLEDIFQKKMDQFLKEFPGCIGTANDITIHGCTEAEHDAHLCNLMQVACKYRVVFNPQKMHVKAPAVNFFGCLYNSNGVHPDPEKVDVVHALPAPTNVTELQEFLGMVTYLRPFIRGLSTLTAPLLELLKKDVDFTWNASYESAFEWVKQAVISDTILRYFDPSLPVTIQVDASQVGLGAALLQNNKPVAFASKALMLEGVDHLVVGDFYSKMIFIQCIPPGQSNANKVILLLKEMFSEHGIPEVLCSDNGPQYASAQFTDFCTSWGITHETSSPTLPTIQWICWSMHQVHQTCTPMSQI